MAKTWAAVVICVASFSRPVGAASKFLTTASDELSISGPDKKSHTRKSAQLQPPSKNMPKRNLGHHVAKKKKFPKVSKKFQACFSALTLGTSPGSTLGQTTEASVNDCMSRCVALDDCYAMSFRMSDGLCNAINRTYNTRFEASDDRVLANKLAGCNHDYGTQKDKPADADSEDDRIEEASPDQTAPEVSEEAQACFTNLVFGVSPGSTLGATTEKSVDDCMMRCAGLEECYAMSFQMSDGLCNAISRTYEARFQASSERVLANKLAGCNKAYGVPKGTKALENEKAEASSGILGKIAKIFGNPFSFFPSVFSV